jgi:membrane fusion protein (multidrug efflux system)
MKTTLSLGLVPALLALACTENVAAPPPPLPEVEIAQVLERDVPVHVEAIGETRGNTEVEIRARVEGFVESVDFQEGSLIEKGQLLYTIDPRPFAAGVSKAKASVAEAQAQVARTHQDVVRYEPLVAKNAISREEYETALALERAAEANLEAAQAVLSGAEIDLSYTRVAAPSDGLVGKTEVYIGTLVGRGQSTLLTRISRIDPIHVRITIPERDYLALARKRTTDSSAPPSEVGFELLLADGSVHPESGRLVFVDRNVDPRTGTILIELAFPNPTGLVRPGQYARVRVQMDVDEGALLVPQRSVVELQGIYSVMIVSTDSKVEQRPVRPGQRLGALWVIDSGLNPGEMVIVEGVQKVQPGILVQAQTVPIEEQDPASERPPGAEAPTADDPDPTTTR